VYPHFLAQISHNTYKKIHHAFHVIYLIIKILQIITNLANKIVVIGNNQFYFKMELVFHARINLIVTKFLQAHNIVSEYFTNNYQQIYNTVILKVNLIKIV
jgi:hypothetical protein